MKKDRGGCTEFIVVSLAISLMLMTVFLPMWCRYSRPDRNQTGGNITKGISNCRQIITFLLIYSSDHDGKYPDAFLADPQSSNEVFRELFKEKEGTDNELIFGCPESPYTPDGMLGPAPEYSKALEAGENHWALTAGLKDSTMISGDIPLIYENPAVASWPPKWNASAKEKQVRGRAWPTGIIVGLNDGSVTLGKLVSHKGTAAGLAKGTDGKDPFEAAIDPVKFPKGVVLVVLRKGE